jgi:hypothetical protein
MDAEITKRLLGAETTAKCSNITYQGSRGEMSWPDGRSIYHTMMEGSQ